MNLTRTPLLERGQLTVDGAAKQRTREITGLKPARRDLYSRIERRVRDRVATARQLMPAMHQRTAQQQFKKRLKRTPLRYSFGRLR